MQSLNIKIALRCIFFFIVIVFVLPLFVGVFLVVEDTQMSSNHE